MNDLLNDLRYAFRAARKTPGHTAALVLVLALGVGCATAMFTVVDRVLLRPLALPHPGRIVQVGAVYPTSPDPLELWSRNHSLEALAYFRFGGVNLSRNGAVERIYAAVVTSGLFSVLEVQPVLGRTFQPSEELDGANRVAILSYPLWLSLFQGSPGALGKTIELNGVPHTVVGVMPAGFALPDHTSVWTPGNHLSLGLDLGPDAPPDATFRFLTMIGRLRPGVTVGQADREHRALFRELAAEHTSYGSPQGVALLQDKMVGSLRAPLLTLFAAVLFVLLIGCANAANLLLARAAGRRREVAVRACLGAGRARIARQLLTESLVPSLGGALAGIALADGLLHAIRVIAPANIPRLAGLAVDGRVLAFSLALALITGMSAGLAPLLQLFAPDLARALKDQQTGVTASNTGRRLRSLLVVAEIALALVLVAGASLTVESLARLTSVDTGLDANNVLTADLGLPHARYRSAADAAAFRQKLYDKALAIPGTLAAGGIGSLPFGGPSGFMYFRGLDRSGGMRMNTISGDYFRAIGIPLIAGRSFTTADGPAAHRVLIINRTMARRIFGDANPIGRQLEIESNDEVPREVVGVVGDIRAQTYNGAGADAPATPEFYVSELQPLIPRAQAMTLVLRTAAPAAGVIESLRKSLAALDPEVPLFRVRTMRDVLFQSTAPPRFRALVLGTFAALAFLLALFGVYGVVAYNTAARTQEIGLRISLGAQRADILRLVVGQGIRLGLAGAAAGVALSLWLTRFLASLLFDVTPSNLLIHAAAALVLVAAVLAASIVPALRAARISPLSALKYE